MRFVKSILFTLAAGALAASVAASPVNPKDDVDYLTLPAPLATDTGNKIEVVEFFAYYCPHCNAFEPKLNEWVKRQGANIVFKRVHVERGPQVAPQQRLYITLEAMGLAEKYHQKVFDAMHRERLPLATDEQVFAWAEKAGIERAKFIDTYRSFGIQAKIRRSAELMNIYRVDRWPYIAINGQYVTSPSQVQAGMPERASEEQLLDGSLQVMDYLVAKARAEKK